MRISRQVLTLLAAFAAWAACPWVAAAQAIYLGMDRERIVGVLGDPLGVATSGEREILRYPNNAQVILVEGRTIEIKRLPHHFSYQLYLEANGGVDPLGPPKVPQESSARLVQQVDLAPLVAPSAVLAAEGGVQRVESPAPVPGEGVPAAAAAPVEAIPGTEVGPAPGTVAPSEQQFLDPFAAVEAVPAPADAEAKAAELLGEAGVIPPPAEPPSALSRLVRAVALHAMNLGVTWLTLFIAFRWEGLVTHWMGLVAVALVDFAVRLAGAGLAFAIFGMESLFGLEKFVAIPVMLVTVMKFTSATTIPTAVRITIGVTVASYLLGYLLVMIPLQFAFFR